MKRGKRQITNTVNIFGLEGEQTSNPFLDLGNKSQQNVVADSNGNQKSTIVQNENTIIPENKDGETDERKKRL